MDTADSPKPASPVGKEPWLAVNLSRIFPGIGQMYAGKVTRGWLIAIATAICWCVGGWLIISATGNALVGVGLLLLATFVINIWNLFDAHRCARKANTADFEQLRKQTKDPWLAVFLSQLLPGLGQAYLNKWVVAILFFVLTFGLAIARSPNNPALAVLAGLASLVVAIAIPYHAYVTAPVRREHSRKAIVLLIVCTLIPPVLLALTIRQWVAEARYIPSGAMQPTLQINDRLIINKLHYRFAAPQRGDIVVFMPTAALKQQNMNDAFIKRIVGLPNETVEVKAGKVFINGKPLQEDYQAEPPQYTYGPVKVPANSYFVLGDNRNNSYDSHYWGFVPQDHIIGKAVQRFYPPERIGPMQ